MMLEEVAIGVVLHEGKLTAAVRRTTTITSLRTVEVASAEVAAHKLQNAKYKLRQDGSCDPQVFVVDTPEAGQVVELLRKHDPRSYDRIVYGSGPAATYSPSGTPYVNQRSELIDKFLRQVHAKKLLLPDDEDLVEQTAAFQDAHEERDSGIWYPQARAIAKAIGQYPAKFVAVVHATIPAPPPGELTDSYL